jgi:hypothetical protein
MTYTDVVRPPCSSGCSEDHVHVLKGTVEETAFTLGTVSTHADEARHFADETEVHNDALSLLYGEERRDSVRIAQVHQNLRTSQKLAEVHALLAIADEMRLLREELTA